MKIAVLLKSVPDTAAMPQIADDGKSVRLEELEFVLNPYDEYALEEAVRLQETHGGTIEALSLGGEPARRVLRTAIAVGADRAILIRENQDVPSSGRGTALVLAAALQKSAPDLILAGKQAVDGDGAQVPERIAEILGLPHASAVTRCRIGEGLATVDRAVEGGQLVLELPLPAVLSVEKGINTPRYPTLPNILKAKRKPIEEVTMADLGIDPDRLRSGLAVESLSQPHQHRRGVILQGELREQARELITALRRNDIAI